MLLSVEWTLRRATAFSHLDQMRLEYAQLILGSPPSPPFLVVDATETVICPVARPENASKLQNQSMLFAFRAEQRCDVASLTSVKPMQDKAYLLINRGSSTLPSKGIF